MRFAIGALWLALASGLCGQDSLAAKYPGDVGIESDADVLFADNFENGNLDRWDERKGLLAATEETANSGRWSVRMPLERGRNTVAHAIKWFMPGADTVYVRFYVKFSADYQYNHHFVTLLANQASDRWSAFGKAGVKPNGTYFSSGMEPWFAWGRNPPPGEVNLYTYFLDMQRNEADGMYWGNEFFPPGPGRGRPGSSASRRLSHPASSRPGSSWPRSSALAPWPGGPNPARWERAEFPP